MGPGDEGAIARGPSTREAPEKRAVDASAPFEGGLCVDTYGADPGTIAAWTRRRGLDDECLPGSEFVHQGRSSVVGVIEEPAALGYSGRLNS
jgi:hypothetical protein